KVGAPLFYGAASLLFVGPEASALLSQAGGGARVPHLELGETLNPAPEPLGGGSVLRRRVFGLDAYEVEAADPPMRAVLGRCTEALAGTDAWHALEGDVEEPRVP